jgi:hypothetical protein
MLSVTRWELHESVVEKRLQADVWPDRLPAGTPVVPALGHASHVTSGPPSDGQAVSPAGRGARAPPEIHPGRVRQTSTDPPLVTYVILTREDDAGRTAVRAWGRRCVDQQVGGRGRTKRPATRSHSRELIDSPGPWTPKPWAARRAGPRGAGPRGAAGSWERGEGWSRCTVSSNASRSRWPC